MHLRTQIVLVLVAALWIVSCLSYEENDASVAEENGEIAQSSYVLPKQIFNDGKPFYLEKNPLSGALDFNSKKTSLLSSPEAIDQLSDKDITLNSNNIEAPNFHDFLNLPVKYTSSKFVYPLVSSSYANLKYQGNNKNFISNHKNDTPTNKISSSYVYMSHNQDKFEQEYLEKKTTAKLFEDTTTKASPTQKTTWKYSSSTQTTQNPAVTTSTIPTTLMVTSTTELPLTTQELPTSKRPQFTRPPLKYTTNKYKYSTIRKRPLITLDASGPSVTMDYSSTTLQTHVSSRITTLKPVPTPTYAFSPLPVTQTMSTLNPADVYSNMITATPSYVKPHKKDPNDMSLSELFNSLLDDDEEITSNPIDSIENTSVVHVKEIIPNTEQHLQSNSPMQNRPQIRPEQNNEYQKVNIRPNTSQIRPTYNQYENSRPNTQQIRPEPTHNNTNDNIYIRPNASKSQPAYNQNGNNRPNTPQTQPEHDQNNSNQTTNTPQIQSEYSQHSNIRPTTQQIRPANHPNNTDNNYSIRPNVQQQLWPENSQHSSYQYSNIGHNFEFVNKTNPEASQQYNSTLNINQMAIDKNTKLNETSPPLVSLDNFGFEIGYNSSMKPQGFTMALTTKTPFTPPRIQIINEQVVIRPEHSPTSIRFPVSDNVDNAPIVTGTYKHDPNIHDASPMALPHNANGLVIFPPNKQQISTEIGVDPAFVTENVNKSSFVSFGFEKPARETSPGTGGNSVTFVNIPLNTAGQQQEVFQVPVQAELNYPSMPSELTLPFSSVSNTQFNEDPNSRPSPSRLHLTQKQKQQIRQHAHEQNQSFQRPHQQPQQHKTPQQLPHERFPNRPDQNEHFPKPVSANSHRPVYSDRPLPNILPQFRPNAKIGYSMNGYHKESSESMQQQQKFNNRRVQQNLQRPPSQYRRTQQTGSKSATSFNVKMAPLNIPSRPEEQSNPNRRYFQVRPNNNERIYNSHMPHQSSPKTNQQPIHRFVDDYTPLQKNSGLVDDSTAGVIDSNELRKSPPFVEPNIAESNLDVQNKLEPVITLQQLQHQKLFQKDSQDQQMINLHQFNPDTPKSVHTASDKPPVYVVYPVKTSPLKLEVVGDKDIDDPVVVGHRGEHPPLPPSEIGSNPQGNEYQNTPFTVIRQEQKPILVVKPKLRFPYPLQRPSGEIIQQDRLINIRPHQGNSDTYDEASYNIGEEPIGLGLQEPHEPTDFKRNENDLEIASKLTRYVQ